MAQISQLHISLDDYDNDDVITPLCIKLPQRIGYIKCFDSYKTMSFKAIYSKLL